MSTRLTGLAVKDVSLVGRPANRRRFILTKSEGEGTMAVKLDEVKALQAVEAADAAGFGFAIEALAGADPLALDTVVSKGVTLTEEEQARIRAALRVLGEPLAKRLADIVGAKPAAQPEGTPVEGMAGVYRKSDGSYDLSGIPEGQRAFTSAILKRLDAAEARVRAADERTATEEQIAVVKSLNHLPGITADDLAPVLKGLKSRAPEDYTRILKVLKDANTAFSKLGLTEALGVDGEMPLDGTASGEIQKLARAKVEKSEGKKLSMEDAILQVCNENPALYRRHQQEQRAAQA